MSDEMTRREHLIEGFLGDDPETQWLYGNSVNFTRAIDGLVNLVPAWVEGMAKQARAQDAQDRQRLLMERIGLPPLSPEEAQRQRDYVAGRARGLIGSSDTNHDDRGNPL